MDTSGSILELGAHLPDGSLASAPPGISSTNGKGENATLQLRVAKSGRTTGLTCGRVTALDLDVAVDYYGDCAETQPYLTKTFTGQIAVSGDRFSDAGDSGALVVDSANAEPVGLFFAGGIDGNGVSHAIASPAPDVLNELSGQMPGGANLSFVGTTDHEVSCLSYGDSTSAAAQAKGLSDAEMRGSSKRWRLRGTGKSFRGDSGDRAGKEHGSARQCGSDRLCRPAMSPTVPAGGRCAYNRGARDGAFVALGSAPVTATSGGTPALPSAAVAQAIAVKRKWRAG